MISRRGGLRAAPSRPRLASLRLRLVVAASALIALALAMAAVGLVVIFDRVLDARAVDELDRTAKFLAGQVSVTRDGTPAIAVEPGDPRFAAPYGGLYWQVSAPGDRDLRSRSLWDRGLDRSAFAMGPSARRTLDVGGPDGARLLVVARRVTVDRAGQEVPLVVAVAMDRRDLAASRDTYLHALVPSMLILGLVLALAMWVFVERALAPFLVLREDLRAIHRGERSTLPTHFPDEVQPLVDDLNRLIAAQERALQRARTQAGDMAHGLKTPLAVLSALARRMEEERPDLSREIGDQALAMGRQVDRALARARVAASANLRRRSCLVAPVVARLVATFRRLPDGDSLVWDVSIPEGFSYPGAEEDLTEIVGNLLDNARKWAHRRVVIRATLAGAGHVLSVEDDGPGMSEDAMGGIARGQRWDESVPGTGFGIAIAVDIAKEAGCTVALGRSSLGGLGVVMEWRG